MSATLDLVPGSPIEEERQQEGYGGVQEEADIELDVEGELSEEGHTPLTLPDPGTPNQEGVDRHNTAHIPYMTWCPACALAMHVIATTGGERARVANGDPRRVIRDRRGHLLLAHLPTQELLGTRARFSGVIQGSHSAWQP